MIQPRSPRRIDTITAVERVGDELLVYDELRHKAFCLNRTSAAVWNLCDGTRNLAQIAEAASLELSAPVSEDLVLFALDQLRGDGLLQDGLLQDGLLQAPADSVAPEPVRPRLSRRDLMEKLGTRTLILLPAVAAILVPEAAQALSGVVTGSQSGPAQSGPNQSRVRQSLLNQQAAAAARQGSSNSDPYTP